MRNFTLTLLVIVGLGTLQSALAGTCKLTERITFQSGKVKVEVSEVDAESRDACKFEAERRRAIDPGETDIKKKTVSFGWRGE